MKIKTSCPLAACFFIYETESHFVSQPSLACFFSHGGKWPSLHNRKLVLQKVYLIA
jgi:hypothetical protein